MAFTKTSNKNMAVAVETKTCPASATVGYGSEIDFLKLDPENNNRYISVLCSASAVTGTNLDIALYGAHTSGGTKFLLVDAIVADITNSAKTAGGRVDLNAYPAPYYYIGWTADADESANTITVSIAY
jgi:hypothetical protein